MVAFFRHFLSALGKNKNSFFIAISLITQWKHCNIVSCLGKQILLNSLYSCQSFDILFFFSCNFFYIYTIRKKWRQQNNQLWTQKHAPLFYIINFKECVDTIIRIVSVQESNILSGFVNMVSKGFSSPPIKCLVPHVRFSPLPQNFKYLTP